MKDRVPIPKSQWGPGPWQNEPDQFHFVHAGLECYIFRNTWVTGCLNGYVGIPPTHPWWGKDYNECVATPRCEPEPPPDWSKAGVFRPPPEGSSLRAMMAEARWHCDHTPESLLEVHGGITYGGPMPSVIESRAERMDDWGFGFDTGHAWDIMPLMDATLRGIFLAKPGGAREWEEHERIFKVGPMAATYKNLAYVHAEVERLAEQLAKIGGNDGGLDQKLASGGTEGGTTDGGVSARAR